MMMYFMLLVKVTLTHTYVALRCGHVVRDLKAKQKLGVTFNSDKLGDTNFTKFSKLTVCTAWEEILKCLKFKLKTDSISLRIVKF